MKRFIFLLLMTVIGSGDFMTKPASAQTLDPGTIYVYVTNQAGIPLGGADV